MTFKIALCIIFRPMRNFESRIFEKLNLDETYRIAEKFLEQEEIKIENFTDLYVKEDIEKDRQYVEEMEAKSNQKSSSEFRQSKKLATIFEAVLHSQVELNDWFGHHAITIKPSHFDHIKNGVDSIAEFQEPEKSASYFALAIDATSSLDVQDKFDSIKREIKQGELAKIKYFSSDYMNRRELDKVPRVIICAEPEIVKELGQLWVEKNNKALEKHPIQFIILKEILIECEIFKNYAKKVNQPEIAAIYEKSQKIVQEIYNEKQSLMTREEPYDDVLNAIRRNLKSL